MFETVPTESIEQSRLMGKWHQMYKAAINFDVFRTQMFCPVTYCKLLAKDTRITKLSSVKSNPVMGAGGFTIEEAYRVISKTGPIETYKRDVTQSSPGKYWMYTEEYFYPSQCTLPHEGTVCTSPVHIIAAGPVTPNDTEIVTNATLSEEISMDDTPYDYIIATDANRLRLEVRLEFMK